MRGRKLTEEEMRCPEKLLDVRCPYEDYCGENYVILIPPASYQKFVVNEELDYRMEEWRMTNIKIRTEDYLSAIVSFCRYIYQNMKDNSHKHQNLLVECPFEDEYMDWLENGMEPEELELLVDSMSRLLQPLLFGLQFVSLSDAEVYSSDDSYRKEWTVVGEVVNYPKIYENRREQKRLNRGEPKNGWNANF